jgi:hypothetical protein
VEKKSRGTPEVEGAIVFFDQGAIQNVRPAKLSQQVQAKAGSTTKEEWSLQASRFTSKRHPRLCPNSYKAKLGYSASFYPGALWCARVYKYKSPWTMQHIDISTINST